MLFFVGNLTFELPWIGTTSLYTLIVGTLSVVMLLYFLINTGIHARRLALLDGKRLERKQAKQLEEKKKESPETQSSTP